MAKDPSKKGVRKIPPGFIEWIEKKHGKEVAEWYVKTTGLTRGEASRQRQKMSATVGSTGAFHEGHFQGAKDFDPEMGGGPTTGRSMRPEMGVANVAHAEQARLDKLEMRRLGVPQFWLDDFYEAVLESEGMRVIGNPDVQASLDIDRGMPPEQAAAQTRVRDDLRAQGENIPGSRYTATNKPAPIDPKATTALQAPKFDASGIKTGSGIPEVVGISRASVPRTPVSFNKGVARLVPSVGVAVGLNALGERVMAGDFEGAAGEGVAAVVGEVPVAGDILVTEAEGRAAGTGSAVPQGMTGQEYTRQQVEEAKTSKNFQQKLANEAEWAVNNPGEALTNVAEAGVSTLAAAGQAALDNPMLQPYTMPLKAFRGGLRMLGF